MSNDEKLILNIHGHLGNGKTTLMLMLANKVFDKGKFSQPWLLSAEQFTRDIEALSSSNETQQLIDNPYLFIDIVQFLNPLDDDLYIGGKLSAIDHLLAIIKKRMEKKRKTIFTSDRSLFDFRIIENFITPPLAKNKIVEAEIKRLSPQEENSAFVYYCTKSGLVKDNIENVYKDYLYQGYSFGSLRGVEDYVNKLAFYQSLRDGNSE